MLEISIVTSKTAGKATDFSLSPSCLPLGGKDSDQVDFMHFNGIPDAWKGLCIRATFVPNDAESASVAVLLDDSFQFAIPSAVTQAAQGGKLVVDAAGTGYHAFTRAADYTVYPHPAAGGAAPTPPADEWTQLVTQVQSYTAGAQQAKENAAAAAATASAQAAAAQQSENKVAISEQNAADSAAQLTALKQTIEDDTAELSDARIGADGVSYQSVGHAVRTQIQQGKSNFDAGNPESVLYGHQTGTWNYFPATARIFLQKHAAPGELISRVEIKTRQSTDTAILLELWEKQDNLFTKVKTFSTARNYAQIDTLASVEINYFCTKDTYLAWVGSKNGCVTYYDSSASAAGINCWYTNDLTAETIALASLKTFRNLAPQITVNVRTGKATDLLLPYTSFRNNQPYGGWMAGNIVVFGDSTVDGTTTTGQTANVIGTDRTASAQPHCFTSVLETMLREYAGGTVRVYNAGFSGKTLSWIAENYAAIMAPFTNVKTAYLVLDVNSASGTIAAYKSTVLDGMEKLTDLLNADGITCAVVSPQPMFYYPAQDSLCVNGAGEALLAMNLAKDFCRRRQCAYIPLSEKLGWMMESTALNNAWFYGDRAHFGDNGHRAEAYALYSLLYHPIAEIDGNSLQITMESAKSEVPVAVVPLLYHELSYGYLFVNDTVYSGLLQRVYVLAKNAFTVQAIKSKYERGYLLYVDDVLYTESAEIPAGAHKLSVFGAGGTTTTNWTGILLQSVQ